MSFTRFHDDPARILKGVQQSTFACEYAMNKPGPGLNMPYFEDSQLRLQKWGANMWSDSTNLESELRGLGKPLNHGVKTFQETGLCTGSQKSFSSDDTHTEESRASHPAWIFRDLEQTRWEAPIINPQAHAIRTFDNLIQSRIMAKDQFVRGEMAKRI
jgi:hypothetical protein